MRTREEWERALDANHDDACTLGDIARDLLSERETAVEKAVREERAAVVRHLRAHADGYGRACAEAHELNEKADQIARGDHRK